jgi:acid stress-induced BolA-like protein IbaG/YrbA
VDLKEKVTEALRLALQPQHLRLEDDDGISGYVVSAQFRDLPALDRQMLIDNALRAAPAKLTKAELRHILAIAGLTPAEYDALGDREDITGGRRGGNGGGRKRK